MINQIDTKNYGIKTRLLSGENQVTNLIDSYTKNISDNKEISLNENYIFWFPILGEFLHISYIKELFGTVRNNLSFLTYTLSSSVPIRYLNIDVIIIRKFKYLNYNLSTTKHSDYNQIIDSLTDEIINYTVFNRLAYDLSNLKEDKEDYPLELFN